MYIKFAHMQKNKGEYMKNKKNFFFAFTLAEVLITLGIIGVVAAMTMPSLIQNHRKTVVISKLKKMSSTLSQAYQAATEDIGVQPSEDCDDCLKAQDGANAAEVFNKYYAPYLKGVEVKAGEKGAFAFFNDDSALYFIRTSTCGADWACSYIAVCVSYKACNNIDESKNLNSIVNGKDVFMLYTGGGAPSYTYKHTGLTREQIRQQCKNSTNSEACTSLIIGDGWTIAKDYPIRL